MQPQPDRPPCTYALAPPGPPLSHHNVGFKPQTSAGSPSMRLRPRLWPSVVAPQSAPVPPCPVSVQCAVACARAARCSPPSPLARTCHVPWLAQVSPAPPSASPHSDATHVPLRSTARLPRRRRPLMPCAVALDCASLGVAALSSRVPLRLTAPFVVDAVAQECSCLQNQGCGKNQSRPDGHKWRGESRLRSTLGALVGLATILRRRSARPHEDIVPHQTFG